MLITLLIQLLQKHVRVSWTNSV